MVKKNNIIQKVCRSCSNSNLYEIITLGNLYLSYFTNGAEKPPKYPLTLVLCKKCALVQLKHTVQQSQLYTENYGYKSSINQTMQNELKEIVEKVLEKIEKNREVICLDIGANDGTLLKYYPKTYTRVAFEPIKKLAKECKENADIVINDFFNFKAFAKKVGNKKVQIITVISCFYDIESPNEFIHDIVKMLDEDGIFVIQQNYLVDMLNKTAFDNIVHEHLEYYSLTSLKNLLAKYGLEIFDVEKSDINGGSFRTFVAFKGTHKISLQVKIMEEHEKQLSLKKMKIYKNFAKNINQNKKLLLKFINKVNKEKKKVYIYGASTRGNTLLQYFEINKKLIPYAVEKNPEKWGKLIASVGIPIISEEQARKEKPEYMLVLPWFFKDEFLKREKAYLKSGGHFIFPLPKFDVI